MTKALFIHPSDDKIPKSIDPQKVFQVYDTYRDGIKFAKRTFGYSAIKNVHLRVCVVRAYYNNRDRVRLSRFLETLDTGIPEDSRDVAAILLRNHYYTGFRKTDASKLLMLGKSIYALNSFLDERKISSLMKSKHHTFHLKDIDENRNWLFLR